MIELPLAELRKSKRHVKKQMFADSLANVLDQQSLEEEKKSDLINVFDEFDGVINYLEDNQDASGNISTQEQNEENKIVEDNIDNERFVKSYASAKLS